MAGPFVAGMPVPVPLWMAKVLKQRQLAQIQTPEWLLPEKLAAILTEENSSVMLTTTLPFFYYEIARSLHLIVEKSTLILLQDLTNVRVDKIRKNFHDLSRGDLQEIDGDLPMIRVTGIASVELNIVGPFLQRAFSDFGYLTQTKNAKGASDTEYEKEKSSQETVKKASMVRSRLRRFRS
jgi:GINS complex subunit 2